MALRKSPINFRFMIYDFRFSSTSQRFFSIINHKSKINSSLQSSLVRLNSLSANNSASPEICFRRSNSSLSIPILRMIQLSDIPALVSSATISVINSMLCVPLARLCRMVEAMRLEISLLMTTTGSNPFSRSNIRWDVFMTL